MHLIKGIDKAFVSINLINPWKSLLHHMHAHRFYQSSRHHTSDSRQNSLCDSDMLFWTLASLQNRLYWITDWYARLDDDCSFILCVSDLCKISTGTAISCLSDQHFLFIRLASLVMLSENIQIVIIMCSTYFITNYRVDLSQGITPVTEAEEPIGEGWAKATDDCCTWMTAHWKLHSACDVISKLMITVLDVHCK